MVLGAAVSGVSHGDLETFKAVCGMPCDMGNMTHDILKKNHTIIHEHYASVSDIPAGNEPLDITVSYDGSWQKRGYPTHQSMELVAQLRLRPACQ